MQKAADDRNFEITALAESIAEDYMRSGRLDPLVITEAKGITISFNSYSNSFDGMLEHRAGRFHIYCNLDRLGSSDSPRARFTLCHELGHYFIDDHRNALASGQAPAHPSRCDFESRNLIEREADLFASRLLMPATLFRRVAVKRPVGLPAILGLAKDFGTSVTSAAIRYVDCDVVPCAVMKWSSDRLTWKSLSTDTFRARFRKTVEKVEQLQPDSPTVRALRGDQPSSIGIFEQGTTISAWFPFVRSADWCNDILIEQAIPLGRFGVLTLIYPADLKYSR